MGPLIYLVYYHHHNYQLSKMSGAHSVESTLACVSSAQDSSLQQTLGIGAIREEVEHHIGPSTIADAKPMISEKGNDVCVSVQISDGLVAQGTVIVAATDVSYSMDTMVDAPGGESTGLTILDLVKHALKTQIKGMGESDEYAIVKYSSSATLLLPFTRMTEVNKAIAISIVEALRSEGSTNMWDGMHTALNLVKEHANPNTVTVINVFTDGQPSPEPPRGSDGMLQQYLDQNPNMKCLINTFGFGYNLSSVLEKIAKIGQGEYGFIADPSTVGTVFINSTANALTMIASNVEILIEPINGAKIVPNSIPGYPVQYESWGARILLGTINMGQSRDLLLQMSDFPSDSEQPYLNVTLRCGDYTTTSSKSYVGDDTILVDQTFCRLRACDVIQQAATLMLRDQDGARRMITDLISSFPNQNDPFISALIENLASSDQVTGAFSSIETWNKWGNKYISSIIIALRGQKCINFKDPALQFFGRGRLFTQLQTEMDSIFASLPAPVPANTRNTTHSNTRGRAVTHSGTYNDHSNLPSAPSRAPVSMASYNVRGGGCWTPETLFLTPSGSYIPSSDITKDTVLSAPGGKITIVETVVCQTSNTSDWFEVHKIGSGAFTPNHPIKMIGGSWQKPPTDSVIHTNCVMNFVTHDRASVISTDGKTPIIVCTLGHGIEGSIIGHPFWGTESIVKHYNSKFPNNNGYITEVCDQAVKSDFEIESLTGIVY